MSGFQAAENWEGENTTLEPELNPPPPDKIDEKKLTGNEVQRLKERKTTIPKIIQEREQYKTAAKAELKRLVTVTREDGKNLIDLKEFKEISEKIEEEQSAEKMAELLEKIKGIPNQKAKEKEQDEEESEKLDPDDPKLLKFQRKFDKECDDNKDIIGLKQVPGFKAWFAKQRRENPTIKHLKEQIKRFEGQEITDRNGLAPRKEEFENLKKLFTKHRIDSPLKSSWIRIEGLSERIKFRKNAEEMEDNLRKLKGTGFYSKEVITETMQKILLADSPLEQKRLLTLSRNVARIEAQSFTHLDSKITIGGVTIRKMSKKGKDQLVDYYKTLALSEREDNVRKWPEFIQAEANLALELEEIYRDNKEGLKLALGSFEELNFEEKENALKEHKDLVENSDDNEELEKTLTIKAACAKIDEAARKKIVSTETQKEWKAWFKSEKAGGVEALKKNYQIMISPTINKEFQNLALFEARRIDFHTRLKKAGIDHPNFKKEEQKAFQDRYDNSDMTKRKIISKELKQIEKEDKEQEKIRELERKAGIEKKGEKENAENPKLKKTIETAQTFMNDGQNAEALKTLIKYWETDLENKEILFWIGVAKEKIKEFGSGKKQEDTTEKRVEEEVEKLAKTDEGIKDQLEEQQIKTLNLKGQRQSEERHQEEKSAKERSKKESLSRVKEGSLEEDLTEDFYEQTEENIILDEGKTGEEVRKIKFNEVDMTDEERQRLREETEEDLDKLTTKKGMADVISIDKTGRKMSAEEAEVKQEKELEQLEQEMAEKALKREDVYDLNTKITARREARRIIEEKRHKKLEKAA